jgi:hypothetical protein
MTDLSKAIIPKSDQMNADDLLTGSKTIKITGVKINSGDQAVSVNFEGDNKKPWKPCKSMCRILVAVWGADGDVYVGKSLTLYCDPAVKWAGAEVGGIRISHMSNLEKNYKVALTVTRGKKKMYVVKPLVIAPELNKISDEEIKEWETKFEGAECSDDIKKLVAELKKRNCDKDSREQIMVFYDAANQRLISKIEGENKSE